MFIIDRFEGAMVVLEYEGHTYTLPRKILPPGTREGDVLRAAFLVDAPATAKRRERIKQLEEDVFE